MVEILWFLYVCLNDVESIGNWGCKLFFGIYKVVILFVICCLFIRIGSMNCYSVSENLIIILYLGSWYKLWLWIELWRWWLDVFFWI